MRMIYVLWMGVFSACFVSCFAFLLGVHRKKTRIQRLRESDAGMQEDGLKKVDREAEKKRKKLYEKKRFYGKRLSKGMQQENRFSKGMQHTRQLLKKAHVKMTLEEFLAVKWMLMGSLQIIGGIFLKTSAVRVPGIIVFLLLGWYLPDFLIARRIHRRQKILNQQLGETLKILSNALKVGQSFFQAIHTLVEEMDGPISDEFKILLKERKLGLSVVEALENMMQRVQSEELRLMATAVIMQSDTGGNLSTVIDNLSKTIQERLSLERELEAASAQGKMSATILALLPPFLLGYVLLVSWETHKVFIEEPIGWAMLFAAIFMELTGVYCIRKILKMKI